MKYLIESEEKQLLKTLQNRKDAERDYMVIHLGLKAGLRRCELSGLNCGDLRHPTGDVVSELKVRAEIAKRKRERTVPLNEDLRDHLKAYFKLKAKWKEDLSEDAPFFVSRLGGRLSLRAIHNLTKKWFGIADLGADFAVHALRHSFAKRILERNHYSPKVLPTIQRLLGHTSLASTGIYLEPGREELAAAVNLI